MMNMPVPDHQGYPCPEEGCVGVIEATVPLWLTLDSYGHWSVYGVGDEAAQIACDHADHQNLSRPLHKSLSAFLDELFPFRTAHG